MPTIDLPIGAVDYRVFGPGAERAAGRNHRAARCSSGSWPLSQVA